MTHADKTQVDIDRLADVAEYITEARARTEIIETLYRYCSGIDRVDEELIRSAYHPDAYDDHGTYRGLAWDFAAWAVPILRERFVATAHRVSNIRVLINGDAAAVQSYLAAIHVIESEEQRSIQWVGGRYLDRFERRGDWRIAHRKLVLDWHTELSAPPLESYPEYNKGLRNGEDAFYALFAAVQEGRPKPDSF